MSLKLKLSGDILSARKGIGWTQPKAAEMAGISLREYQNIESGKCMPTTEVFLRLKFLYELDIEKYREDVGMTVPELASVE